LVALLIALPSKALTISPFVLRLPEDGRSEDENTCNQNGSSKLLAARKRPDIFVAE
jgi:hypothetical protein